MNQKLNAKLLAACLDEIIDNARLLRDAAIAEYVSERPSIENRTEDDEPLSDEYLRRLDDILTQYETIRNNYAEATEIDCQDIEISWNNNERYTAPE